VADERSQGWLADASRSKGRRSREIDSRRATSYLRARLPLVVAGGPIRHVGPLASGGSAVVSVHPPTATCSMESCMRLQGAYTS